MATPDTNYEQRIERGANWFYWIAGLSAVNAALGAFEADRSFPLGLGVTQLIDGLAVALDSALAKGFGFIADGVIILLVALVGYAARRGFGTYVVGMVLYGLDGLINLVVGDWVGTGLHAFAIVAMFNGAQAFRQREQAKTMIGVGTLETPIRPAGL
jgi:hypothetical protein